MRLAKEELPERRVPTVQPFPAAVFRVKNVHETRGATAGKMREHRIRVLVDDHAPVERTSHDPAKDRITYRLKQVNR